MKNVKPCKLIRNVLKNVNCKYVYVCKIYKKAFIYLSCLLLAFIRFTFMCLTRFFCITLLCSMFASSTT